MYEYSDHNGDELAHDMAKVLQLEELGLMVTSIDNQWELLKISQSDIIH